METRVSGGNTAATTCSPCVHLRLASPAQAKEGEAGGLGNRGRVGALVSLSMGSILKASKTVVLKLCSVEARRMLGNPGEEPQGGHKERGQAPGLHTGSPQRLFAYSTHLALL